VKKPLQTLAVVALVTGCASIGLTPIPYTQEQSGPKLPFGFFTSVNENGHRYIEFQGTTVNRFEDMEKFVASKALEVCNGKVKDLTLSRGVWYIAVDGLGMPGTGTLPSTGHLEAFPKVTADVQCL